MAEIEIRPAVEADLERLTEIYNHYILHTAATFDIEPFTMERRREWFRHYAASGPYRVLVAHDGRDLLGFSYSGRFRDKQAYDTTVETSVYCDPGQTGRGLGGRLYAALFAALAEAPVSQAFALITVPNDASIALHERFGFEHAGTMRRVGRKFGRFWDVAIYQRPVGPEDVAVAT